MILSNGLRRTRPAEANGGGRRKDCVGYSGLRPAWSRMLSLLWLITTLAVTSTSAAPRPTAQDAPPANPAAADGLPAEAVPAEPAQAEPAPAEPVPAEAFPAEPAPAEPAPAQPVPAEAAPADTPALEAPRVHLVRVPLPIRGNVDQLVQQAIEQVVNDRAVVGATRPVLVLEFRAEADADAKSSQFERSLALARYLTGPSLTRVRTVAYLPESVTGHAVLPVVACETLIMHPDAVLGDAGVRESVVDATMVRGYREIVERRGTLPFALVLGMLEPAVEVVQVTTVNGTQIRLQSELAELQQREVIQNVKTIVPAGQRGSFTGRALRLELQLIGQLASDRVQLAAALGVAPEAFNAAEGFSEGWKAVRVELKGPIHAGMGKRVQQACRLAVSEQQANLILLEIESPGGDPVASVDLAHFLVDLSDERVRTVAYITGEARADAAFVAWACDQVVLKPQAIWGGPGGEVLSDVELDDLRRAAEELAKRRGRSWSAVVAMMDGRVRVRRYERVGSSAPLVLSADEAAKVNAAEGWTAGDELGIPGESWEVSANEAVDLGLAFDQAESLAALTTLYGIEGEPNLVTSRWAYELIDALARPEVAATLLFLGGLAVFIELTSPGLGIGAFLAAVCFILYFWSNYLHGTAEWLEILLFLLGAVFLLIEIFVLPGLTIFGLGGVCLMVASLVLATQTFVLPTNEYQFRQLPKSLGIVAAGFLGLAVGAATLGRFIDRLPFFRQFELPVPKGAELAELQKRESLGDYTPLLGQTGYVATPLRPAGKVRFGERLVDVVSTGEPVEVGQRVRVESVEGTRVVVVADVA